MLKINRILLLLGTLLLAGAVAVSFAACDTGNGGTTDTTASTTEAPTEAPAEEATTEAPTEASTEEATTEEETAMDPQAELSKLNELMQPIFGGTTVKNETVMFLDKGDVRSLLYSIETVISVTNYDGSVTYEEGKDYVIEDGKLSTHVKSFTVAGNFYDMLKEIVALSDKVELPMATSSTAFGAPAALIKSLSIAGK